MAMRAQEEAFFYDMNRMLIDQRRERLDQLREKLKKTEEEKSFWMVCPKCGGHMAEVNVSNIIVDQCVQCKGIFFDSEEFITLVQSREHKTFLDYLNKICQPDKWLADL